MSLSFAERLRRRKNRKKVYGQPSFWDEKARHYQGSAVSLWQNEALNQELHREHLQLLDELLPEVTGARLLDLGCGTGRMSRHLAERGAIVTGIDFSTETLALARQETDHPAIIFQECSVFDLPSEPLYDGILCLAVLTVACSSEESLRAALARIATCLGKGRPLLLIEPIHTGHLHRTLDLSLKRFLAILQESGFRIQEERELHFWPTRLLLCHANFPAGITRLIFRVGQQAMTLLGKTGWGDYKAILAIRS